MQLWPDITHADVDPDSQVAQEEIFGPVLTVTPYDTDDEAGAIANNTIYGLSREVSSADVDRAFEVAKRMRTAEPSSPRGERLVRQLAAGAPEPHN
jgi:acyl-CoA reductase-like NAD-dependent aldehyde dehydrogenase